MNELGAMREIENVVKAIANIPMMTVTLLARTPRLRTHDKRCNTKEVVTSLAAEVCLAGLRIDTGAELDIEDVVRAAMKRANEACAARCAYALIRPNSDSSAPGSLT